MSDENLYDLAGYRIFTDAREDVFEIFFYFLGAVLTP